MTDAFIPALNKRPPELFPNFYAAMLLERTGRLEEAGQWLDKALVLRPEFWQGRLMRLRLSSGLGSSSAALDADLDFFISQSGRVTRFVCAACGLHRGRLFYCCPRCGGWHSAGYRFSLDD
jgi:lipopolysaccharide biosynthesis regulator YciM